MSVRTFFDWLISLLYEVETEVSLYDHILSIPYVRVNVGEGSVASYKHQREPQ